MSHQPVGATPMRKDAVTNTAKPCDEDPASAQQVTEPGTEQQQAAEHQV